MAVAMGLGGLRPLGLKLSAAPHIERPSFGDSSSSSVIYCCSDDDEEDDQLYQEDAAQPATLFAPPAQPAHNRPLVQPPEPLALGWRIWYCHQRRGYTVHHLRDGDDAQHAALLRQVALPASLGHRHAPPSAEPSTASSSTASQFSCEPTTPSALPTEPSVGSSGRGRGDTFDLTALRCSVVAATCALGAAARPASSLLGAAAAPRKPTGARGAREAAAAMAVAAVAAARPQPPSPAPASPRPLGSAPPSPPLGSVQPSPQLCPSERYPRRRSSGSGDLTASVLSSMSDCVSPPLFKSPSANLAASIRHRRLASAHPATGPRRFSGSWLHTSPSDPLLMPRLPTPLGFMSTPSRGLPRAHTPSSTSSASPSSASVAAILLRGVATLAVGAAHPGGAAAAAAATAGERTSPSGVTAAAQLQLCHAMVLQAAPGQQQYAPLPLHELRILRSPLQQHPPPASPPPPPQQQPLSPSPAPRTMPAWQAPAPLHLTSPRPQSPGATSPSMSPEVQAVPLSPSRIGGGAGAGGGAGGLFSAMLEIRSKQLTPTMRCSRPSSATVREEVWPMLGVNAGMWALGEPLALGALASRSSVSGARYRSAAAAAATANGRYSPGPRAGMLEGLQEQPWPASDDNDGDRGEGRLPTAASSSSDFFWRPSPAAATIAAASASTAAASASTASVSTASVVSPLVSPSGCFSPSSDAAATTAAATAAVPECFPSEDVRTSRHGMPLRRYFENEMSERAARVGNLHAVRRVPARNISAVSRATARDERSEAASAAVAAATAAQWHQPSIGLASPHQPAELQGPLRPRRRFYSETNV